MFKKIHVFRVIPKTELFSEIMRYCDQNKVDSAIVLGIIGSLESVGINYIQTLPGNYEKFEYPGPLEIVCAQGSVALKNKERIIHIHIQVGSKDSCMGGHLAKANIFSTAEVMLGELDYQLMREYDEYTGLNELVK